MIAGWFISNVEMISIEIIIFLKLCALSNKPVPFSELLALFGDGVIDILFVVIERFIQSSASFPTNNQLFCDVGQFSN